MAAAAGYVTDADPSPACVAHHDPGGVFYGSAPNRSHSGGRRCGIF